MSISQNQMPLIEAIQNHIRQKPISFHVPGHKNGELYHSLNLLNASFLQWDLTELSGLDDLHDPSGAIEQAEGLLSSYYQSVRSYFLVNGSTVGNISSILATCNEGDYVLVQRNCHKSILNGIQLARAVPIFIEPEWDKETQTATGVHLSTLEEAIQNYPEAVACIFTYPTYYGVAYPIKQLIEAAHQGGMTVIVDEAHGAHFKLGEPVPQSTLDMGADVIIQSAHKMLPAMTMGSYLHINSEKVSIKKIENYLRMLQSSSPSYPIMASLDMARSFIANRTKEDTFYAIKENKKFLEKLCSFTDKLKVIEVDDPFKVILRLDSLNGYQIQAVFEKHGVFVELADPMQVLLILPITSQEHSFPYERAEALIKSAIMELMLFQINTSLQQTVPIQNKIQKVSKLEVVIDDLEDYHEEWILLAESKGRVATKMLTPYPPGIPVMAAGELITEEMIATLRYYFDAGARIQGDHKLEEGKILVIKSDR